MRNHIYELSISSLLREVSIEISSPYSLTAAAESNSTVSCVHFITHTYNSIEILRLRETNVFIEVLRWRKGLGKRALPFHCRYIWCNFNTNENTQENNTSPQSVEIKLSLTVNLLLRNSPILFLF